MIDATSLLAGTATTLFVQGVYFTLIKFPPTAEQRIVSFKAQYEAVQAELQESVDFGKRNSDFLPVLEQVIALGTCGEIWDDIIDSRNRYSKLLLRQTFECRSWRNPSQTNWMRFFEEDFIEFLKKLRTWVALSSFDQSIHDELQAEVESFGSALTAANRRTNVQRLAIKAEFSGKASEIQSYVRLYKAAVGVVQAYFLGLLVYVPFALRHGHKWYTFTALDFLIVIVFSLSVGRPLNKDQRKLRLLATDFEKVKNA